MKQILILTITKNNTKLKNTLLLIALVLILSNLCFAQNTLNLKNGDKMSGKLEGFRNDTILFNFQGNKLQFKTSDIESVYFNDKAGISVPVKETIAADVNPSHMGKISGVVTYLTRFEFKPDGGSDVYFADSTNLKDFNLATLDSFYNYTVYKYFTKIWKPRPENQLIASIYDQGEKYNYDKVNFKSLDKRATMNISRITGAKDVTKAAVDDDGNYSVKVRPGTYYVLFKSRNSARLDKTQTSEPFKCLKVDIGAGENITLSYPFGFEYK